MSVKKHCRFRPLVPAPACLKYFCCVFSLPIILLGLVHSSEVATTRGEGLVFWIEFEETSFVAGTKLRAYMGVSNSMDWPHPFSQMSRRFYDTVIGDFVVEETAGIEIQSPVSHLMRNQALGSRGLFLEPHEQMKFEGYIERSFNLTNPGTYKISARGQFRSTNGVQQTFEMQTPPVAIRILPPTNQPLNQVQPVTVQTQATAPPVPAVHSSAEIHGSPEMQAKAGKSVAESTAENPSVQPAQPSSRIQVYILTIGGTLLFAFIALLILRRNRE